MCKNINGADGCSDSFLQILFNFCWTNSRRLLLSAFCCVRWRRGSSQKSGKTLWPVWMSHVMLQHVYVKLSLIHYEFESWLICTYCSGRQAFFNIKLKCRVWLLTVGPRAEVCSLSAALISCDSLARRFFKNTFNLKILSRHNIHDNVLAYWSQYSHVFCLSSSSSPSTPSVTGSCVAVADYSPVGPDELQLRQGDVVGIQGLLVRGLGVFVGKHASTGHTGFVHKAHVKPLDAEPL